MIHVVILIQRDSLLHGLADTLLHWFADSLVHWLMFFNESLVGWFTASLIHWFVVSLISDLSADSLITWPIDSFTQLCMDSFMSCQWHLNHHLLIRWWASQLQHFVASASPKLSCRAVSSYIVFFCFFESSAPARAGHCLVEKHSSRWFLLSLMCHILGHSGGKFFRSAMGNLAKGIDITLGDHPHSFAKSISQLVGNSEHDFMTPKLIRPWIVVRYENCFLDQKNSSRSIHGMMMVMEMIIITYYDYYIFWLLSLCLCFWYGRL